MYFELAKRNIMRTKLRSSLAVVGIIIGVIAIASIGIFGEGLKSSVLQNFQDLADQVIISPSFSEGYSEIDLSTMNTIERSSYVKLFMPFKNTREFVEHKSESNYASIYGTKEETLSDLYEVEDGSIKLRGSCVVGYDIADSLDLRVGSKVSILDKQLRISAILEEVETGGGPPGAGMAINPNNVVFTGLDDFDNLFDEGFSLVIVRITSLEDVDKFDEFVQEKINLRKEKVDVFKAKSILESIEDAFAQVNLFLTAIAGVSLLVAGVSILNIMFMSTIERTKEIGVMRAIGAYRETILKIYLLEALILGLIGSTIGGVLSLAGGFGIIVLFLGSAEFLFNLTTLIQVTEGVVFGILTAIISGLYPAWKASRYEPIEALRYE